MIEARGLTKRYGHGSLALDDLSLSVSAGEIYGLWGGPGSGKTTAFRLFSTAITPTRGQAIVGGIDTSVDPLVAKRRAAFISSEYSLFTSLTIRQNVEFFVRIASSRRPSRSVMENALRRVGVPERAFDQSCKDLAEDVLILVWLAIAALRECTALLLDDPTIRLSTRGAAELRDSLLDLRGEGMAILVMTSDVSLATQVADHVGIVQAGRLVVERTRAEFGSQSVSQFDADYTGRSGDPGPPRLLGA